MLVYEDSHVRLYHGHVLDVLRLLPDEHAQTVVTSPPYWGLRNYNLPPQVWGGRDGCRHAWGSAPGPARRTGGVGKSTLHGWGSGNTPLQAALKNMRPAMELVNGTFCRRCGAWRGSLGLEPTPELYMEHLVQVFEEIHRVLRADGTVWLNLGDCYVAAPHGFSTHDPSGPAARDRSADMAGPRIGHRSSFRRDRRPRDDQPHKRAPRLKPKDMVGMPWRVAFALQSAGWYLRRDIIWQKANAMPESIRDRCTTAHEYLFHLAKSEDYFYDGKAIEEQVTGGAHARGHGVNPKAADVDPGNHRDRPKQNAHFSARITALVTTRNKRSVWTIPTQPFLGHHYAVFPEDLVKPCIQAGTSERGACPVCGAPWERVLERVVAAAPAADLVEDGQLPGLPPAAEAQAWKVPSGWDTGPGGHTRLVGRYAGKHAATHEHARGRRILAQMAAARQAGADRNNPFPQHRTVGWRPTCSHYDAVYRAKFPRARAPRKRAHQDAADTWFARARRRPAPVMCRAVPCVVLEPFSGAGTVALVAKELGRRAVAGELNGEYIGMTVKRLRQEVLSL